MAKYTGKKTVVNKPAQDIYDKFKDLTALQAQMEQLPDDVKAQMGEIHITQDSIIIVTPQVGEVELRIKERIEPQKVAFITVNSPMPLEMSVNISPVDENSCEVYSALEVDIPLMLRPLVGPQLQKAADGFGETLLKLYN